MKLLKTTALFMIYLVITISFVLYSPEKVSAAEQACCQLTKTGEYCSYTDKDDCNPSYLIAPNVYCENIDFCKLGCCYDTDDGSCSSGVPKSRCESKPDSVFNPDPQCNIDQCRLGCCQISNQCSLATQTKCRATVSKYPGVEMIFHSSILTEQECVDQCRGTDQGACVSPDGSCARTIRAECTDSFHVNQLCSHPSLGTNCAPQQTTNCVGEDVYWFDSCGNQENIYNSNKRVSYNSGYIQKEQQACKAQPNDKNCGNCDYITGTLCGEGNAKYGNYICKDMNCYGVYQNSASPNSGGNKKHGESWCIYDTLPGPGKDTVGSRHRKHYCLNGEEIIEECSDYREEYCIQNKIGDKEITDVSILELISKDFEGYTEALCKENNFADCTTCMAEATLEKQQECCSDRNKDCTWVNYGYTGILSNEASSANGICVPLVPPGLKFWETGESVCAQASQTCKVKEHKELGKGWECKKNCQCKKPNWIVTANRYCKAIGDCGSYYNIEGKATLGGYSLGGKAAYKLALSNLESWTSLSSPSFDGFFSFLSEASKHYKSAADIQSAAWATAGVATIAAYALYASIPTGGATAGAYLSTMSLGAVLFWLAVAVAVIATIIALSTDDRTLTYTFTCEPWEQPDGGRDCEKYNDRNVECTEYLCKSLGKDCELINVGTDDQKCVAQPKTDVTSPVISLGDMDFDIEAQENGFRIKGLVKPFTPVTLKLKTDEAAQCKYSLEPLKGYENMDANFGSSLYLFEHELFIPIPSEATTEEALLATNGGRYELYVKCRDSSKNINTRDYAIKFQIDPGPDQTPPSIEKTLPDNNAPIPHDNTEQEITLLLNEPSDCKWSLVDKDFEQMENEFTCVQTGLDMSSMYYGLYECKTKLTEIKQNQQNTFFFRCKDKADPSNIQQQSYQYNLISTPPLQIIDAKPEGKVYTRYPILGVTTTQGSDNGVATCGFNEKDVTLTNMIQMFNTDSVEHSQQLQPTSSGAYTYYIKCVDKAGNIAEDVITFDLEISLEAAQIFNIYKDLNLLHISTTEKTICEYSEKSFTYGTGTPMTQPDSKDHTANLGLSVYHIICQDKFNNQVSTIIYP